MRDADSLMRRKGEGSHARYSDAAPTGIRSVASDGRPRNRQEV